ncbi:MAG: signal peptidase II [Myxococcota bacterium]|nr:signal peptidase II [Myxococcota bacterium]
MSAARNAQREAPVAALVRRTPRALVLCVVGVIALIALDQASKMWAAGALDGGPIVVLDGVLDLVHAENPGGAWGILEDAPRELRVAGFAVVAIAFSVLLGTMLVRGHGGPLFAWGAPLVIAGALGNLIDRVARGTVTDFVHARWDGVFDYPVFNLADVWIFVGVALLVIDSFRRPARAPGDAQAAAA